MCSRNKENAAAADESAAAPADAADEEDEVDISDSIMALGWLHGSKILVNYMSVAGGGGTLNMMFWMLNLGTSTFLKQNSVICVF